MDLPALLLGLVVGISDGDTLTVLTPEKQEVRVRLAEIDAPEKRQAFGQRSKQSLSDLCYQKQAKLQVVDTDRYGRAVARVKCGVTTRCHLVVSPSSVACGGTDANAAQVQAGMAWAYTRYLEPGSAMPALQDEARTARRGLWADPSPVPPWEFRKARRSH